MSSQLNAEFDVSRSLRSSSVSDIGSNEVPGKTAPPSSPSSSPLSPLLRRRSKPTLRRLTHRTSNIEYLPRIPMPGQKASGSIQRLSLDFQDPIKGKMPTTTWRMLQPRRSKDSLLQKDNRNSQFLNLIDAKASISEGKHSDLEMCQNRSLANRSNTEIDFGLRASRSMIDTEGFKPLLATRNKMSAITSFLQLDSIPVHDSVRSESSKMEDQDATVSAKEIRKLERDCTTILNPANLRGQKRRNKTILLLDAEAMLSPKINTKPFARDGTRQAIDCQLPLPPSIVVIKESEESDDQEPDTPTTTHTKLLNENNVLVMAEDMANIGHGSPDEKCSEAGLTRSNEDNVTNPVLKKVGWRAAKRETTKIKRTHAKPLRSADPPQNNEASAELWDVAPFDLHAVSREPSRTSERLRDGEATTVGQETINSVDQRLVRVLSGVLTDLPPVTCHVVRIFTSSTFTG